MNLKTTMKTHSDVVQTARVSEVSRRAALLLLFGLLLAATMREAGAASSSPPDSMTYQGYLVDANGNPLGQVNPQNYPAAFRIYNAPSGGLDLLWSEQQIVTVDKGNFSVLLGEGTPIGGEPRPALSSIFSGATASDRYISVWVTIGGNTTEILPRLRLVPAPYSFLATSAANLVQPNGTAVVSYTGGQVNITGNLTASGTISGNGSGLTGLTAGQIPNLDASKIISGTLADARLSANVALRAGGNGFNGNQTITGGNVGLRVTDGTATGNIVLQALAGGNSGFSALNFNGYFDGAEQRFNTSKARWRLLVDQRGGTDNFFIDSFTSAGLATALSIAPNGIVSLNNNLGIGTTTPGFPLNFPNTLGDKISLWGQSGNHYGFGIQGGTLQIHSDIAGSAIAFGYGSSANMIEAMRIVSGRVGIGTPSPGASIHLHHNVNAANGQDSPFLITKSTTGGAVLWSRTFTAGGAFNLELFEGQAYKPGGGSWGAVSDQRLKKDVRNLDGALDSLLRLRSVTFEFKDPAAVHETPGRHTGFIAQEVEKVFPEWVSPIADGMKAVAPVGFESLTVQALRELRQEKDAEQAALKKEVAELKQQVATLQGHLAETAQVETLQRELNSLKQIVQQLAATGQPVKTSAQTSAR